MSIRLRRNNPGKGDPPGVPSGELTTSFNSMATSEALSDSESESDAVNTRNRRPRFRHRKKKTADESSEKAKQRKKKDKPLFEDEMDPYDSDPGQSYRAHCMQIQGLNTRSCLRMPALLKGSAKASLEYDAEDNTTESSSPPSPMGSESEDILNQTPASLPPDTSRVRYSLRSAIGDGAAKQPTGPSVMDRRDLRPNGVALNVSHWSDSGSRAYMEDR